MRVAFVLSALQAGGAERIISLISHAAVERGWHATIVTFDTPDDPVFHAYPPQVEFRRLALPAGVQGWRAVALMLRRVAALRRALATDRFDVVVSFLTKINTLTLLATLGSPTPIIVSERNNPVRQKAHPLWMTALNRLYRRAAAIVMLTERSKTCLPSSQRARAVVIANPIPVLRFRPRHGAPFAMVAVGRLDHQKGFDILLYAFARIARDVPGWTLLIWGEGPERDALERQVHMLSLDERVRFAGTSDAPGSWIESANAFVLSSRYEGYANVVGEALSAGLPVIATDCDFGPAEMIAHDINGLLVAPDDVVALAEAMRGVMRSAPLRARLTAGALHRTCGLRAADITNIWLDLIEKQVAPGPAQARATAREPIAQKG